MRRVDHKRHAVSVPVCSPLGRCPPDVVTRVTDDDVTADAATAADKAVEAKVVASGRERPKEDQQDFGGRLKCNLHCLTHHCLFFFFHRFKLLRFWSSSSFSCGVSLIKKQ